jgi:hypothetical protein
VTISTARHRSTSLRGARRQLFAVAGAVVVTTSTSTAPSAGPEPVALLQVSKAACAQRVVRVQPRSFCLLALTLFALIFVCSLARWSKGLSKASLEPVEAAETLKTAKIRRLEMKLKRQAASPLYFDHQTPSTSVGAICRSLAIIFLIYVYISTLLLVLESFCHGQHPKS